MSYKGQDTKKSIVVTSEDGYNLYSKFYDDNNFHLDSFEDGAFDMLYRGVKGKKVLELGAGTGRMTGELLRFGAEVSACDISENMLKVLNRKYSTVPTEVCDIRKLPYKDGSFDIVYAMFVVVHLRELREMFDEAYRVLKEGGIFVLSNINQRKPPKLKIDNKEEIIIESYYHRPDNIINELKECFFSIEDEGFTYNGNVWINQLVKAKK
jgi:ubiquinone/menaquinone biosynthesis C-methylase UbiE